MRLVRIVLNLLSFIQVLTDYRMEFEIHFRGHMES
jgi:hypothetical protein